MTTTAQVKRLLVPFLAKHDDLSLVGRMIVVKPVRHILKAILLDRTSSANKFRPCWFVWNLFELNDSAHLSWGEDIYHPQPRLWLHSDPDMPAQLFQKIEQEVLPKLRPVSSISDLVSLIKTTRASAILSNWADVKIIFDVALGDLASARSLCANEISQWHEATYGRDEDDKAKLRRLKQLCALLAADDRAGLAQLLHAWEAQTVRNLKLEHLWQPSPFPLEMTS